MKWSAFTLSEAASNGLIILGALVAIVLVVFIWAACFRKKPRQRKYRYQHSDKAAPVAATQNGNGDARKKWRRPRRARRQLNPTLAETRGLPPVRDRNTPPQGL
ncbi:MAG: hypothetical protein JWR69_375 [Pedosphaera sp.]|nr:hypothetical protein [Pedosphaera sp.]